MAASVRRACVWPAGKSSCKAQPRIRHFAVRLSLEAHTSPAWVSTARLPAGPLQRTLTALRESPSVDPGTLEVITLLATKPMQVGRGAGRTYTIVEQQCCCGQSAVLSTHTHRHTASALSSICATQGLSATLKSIPRIFDLTPAERPLLLHRRNA
jgi:hypothetical protein